MGVLEASYLGDLLAGHEGNVSAAARTAGIDRKTLHRLINKYHLTSRPLGAHRGRGNSPSRGGVLSRRHQEVMAGRSG